MHFPPSSSSRLLWWNHAPVHAFSTILVHLVGMCFVDLPQVQINLTQCGNGSRMYDISLVTKTSCSRAFHQDSIMNRSVPIMLVIRPNYEWSYSSTIKLKCNRIGRLLDLGRALDTQYIHQMPFIHSLPRYMIWRLFKEYIIALENDFSLSRGSIVRSVRSLPIWVGLLHCVFLALPTKSKRNLFLTSISQSSYIIKVISLLAIALSNSSSQ